MGLPNSSYKKIILACQALFMPPLFVYTVFIEPQWLRGRQMRLNGVDNPIIKALTGVRLLHLSDLHINRMGKYEYKALELIDRLSPDIIFITGDYFDYAGHTKGAMEFLDQLKAPHGVFGILGNVDYKNPPNAEMLYNRYCRGSEPRQTFTMLKNETIFLNLAGTSIRVIGIDDPIIYKSIEVYDKTIAPLFEAINKETPILLLTHRPDIFDFARKKGVDFTLCGHTHGGQMRLPFSLQFYNQSQATRTYNRGLYCIGDMLMHVSPGIGTSDIPMRFLCRPEETLFIFS
jgi:predicted MPP superfamily phosphohydrolase